MENLGWFGLKTSSRVTWSCVPGRRHSRAGGDLI